MSEKKSSPSARKSTTSTSKKSTRKTTTKKKAPSKGLGDTIEKVTEATGIKKAVDWFSDKTGIDCGCEERKAKLNKLVPYNVSCMEKTDYDNWTKFRSENGMELDRAGQDLVVHLHAKLFNHKLIRPCTCSPKRWQEFIDDINKVYNEYEV